MIEEVEVGRLTSLSLIDRNPLGGPAIEGVAGRGDDALFEVRAWIELEIGVGQVAIAGPYLALIGRRVGGPMRRQDPQGADLPAVEADQHRHMGLLAVLEGVDQLFGKDLPIHRADGAKAQRGRIVGDDAPVYLPQRGDVRGAQLRGDNGAAHLRRFLPEHGVLERRGGDHIGAFGDGLTEQALGVRRRHQIENAEAASGFAGDGDVGGIAAEGRDVPLHPAQRLDLVEQAIVAGHAPRRFRTELRMGQIAQNAQAIVHRHHHDAFARELRAVIDPLAGRIGGEGAAMDPDDDRRALGVVRRPDIEIEAVLAHPRRHIGVDRLGQREGLDAGWAELGRLADSLPVGRRLGRGPARIAHRGLGVGQTFESPHHAIRLPLHSPLRGLNDRSRIGMRRKAGHHHNGRRQGDEGARDDHQTGAPGLAAARISTRAKAMNSRIARA